MIGLAEQMSEDFRNSWIGREAEVLFEESEERDGDWYWTGFTREYIRVSYRSGEDLSNRILTVRM